jgi:hypothetical protein
MLSREQPWHLRRLTHEHTQWLKNLRAIHSFNQALALDDATEATELRIELDETQPEDVLGRLELKLWEEHASAWQKIKRKDDFARICRAEGARFAEMTWGAGGRGAKARRATLQEAFAAMSASPFAGYPSSSPELSGFLLKRSLPSELIALCLRCPHSSPFEAIQLDADRICRGQALWYEGLLSKLNPSIALELERPARTCELRLTITV